MSQLRQASPATPTILVIDHDGATRALLTEILSDEGYQVGCVANIGQGIDSIRQAQPDLAIVEMLPTQPEATLDLLAKLRSSQHTQAVRVLVSCTDTELLGRMQPCINAAAQATITKPFCLEWFIDSVKSALQQSV